jgi:hypothetical protein
VHAPNAVFSARTLLVVKAQSKEQNLLVASEREFQDEDWKKVEERTRLYTWAKALSEEPLTRVCNSAVTLVFHMVSKRL